MTTPAPPVIALVDGSPAAANAAWRAALVARDHHWPLHLVHDGARRASGANDAAALAVALHERLSIAVEARALEGEPLQALVRAAREASLLVVGARRGNVLREFILGTQAERLLRLCRVPVLVVKRPALAGYRRVLVPVDLGPDTGRVIATAALFSRDPRIEVLHALGMREEFAMRVAEVPEAVVRRARNRAAEGARSRLERSIAGACLPAPEARPMVGFGDVAAVVLARERALRADLVVLGKRRRALLADFLLGGVTQRVLAAAQADVLMLPGGPARSDLRDQLDLHARAQRDLRDPEGAAGVGAGVAEHLSEQLARAIGDQVVLGEVGR